MNAVDAAVSTIGGADGRQARRVQPFAVRRLGQETPMDDDIERSLSPERRNALESFTASCFRRLPSVSSYKQTDLFMGVSRLALWVATQPDAALNAETVFSASTVDSAIHAGFLVWEPKPRRNVRTMLVSYGELLEAAPSISH
jgi:hypothetical protein